MTQEKNYTLYEIFFEESNEVFYVGITTSHLLLRLSQHVCYKKSDGSQKLAEHLMLYFDQQVKFGIRAVKKNLDKKDALKAEKALINKHRNNTVFFNIAGNINKPSKQCYSIYQIDMKTLEIIKEYSSIRSTGFEGFSPSNIGRVCRGLATCADGYYWCYTKNYETFVPKPKSIFQRSVEELDNNGNVLREFANIKEAALFHNVSSTAVCRWLKQVVPSKMNWRYSSKGYAKKAYIPKKYTIVEIYNSHNTLIDTTNNVMEYCANNNLNSSAVYKGLKTGHRIQGLLFKPIRESI